MQWERETGEEDGGAGAGRKLVVSSVAAGSESERRLVRGLMLVTNAANGVRASSWFERAEAAEQRRQEERKEKSREDDISS